MIGRFSGKINPSANNSFMPGPTPPPPPPLPVTSLSSPRVSWKLKTPHNLSKDCFWTECESREQLSQDILTELDVNFPLKQKRKNQSETKTPSIILKVLDTKSAQALLILIRALFKQSTHEDVKNYIINCNTDKLTSNFIETLIKVLPQPHEMKKLQKMKSDGIKLLDVEEFISDLSDIPRLLPRLISLNFNLQYDDLVNCVETQIANGIAACDEIISSEKFKGVLGLILSFGKHLNSGSNIQHTTAFEISDLKKLKDLKSSSTKKSLMNCIVETIHYKFPELANFSDEIPHVNADTCSNVKRVATILQELTTSSKSVEAELENSSQLQLPGDKFNEFISSFSFECSAKLFVLNNQFSNMKKSYIKVGEFYAFDPNIYKMEDCFTDINIFKGMFATVYSEISKNGKMIVLSIISIPI